MKSDEEIGVINEHPPSIRVILICIDAIDGYISALEEGVVSQLGKSL